jgi:hypothetical protein
MTEKFAPTLSGYASAHTRAISFYERWGFHITGTHHFLAGNDYQKDYLMQRAAGIGAKENP